MSTLIDILNNGIPAEIIGGVASTTLIRLIDKVKNAFNGNPITEKTFQDLTESNAEIKEIMVELQKELKKMKINIRQITKDGINTSNIKVQRTTDKDFDIFQSNEKGDNNQTLEL